MLGKVPCIISSSKTFVILILISSKLVKCIPIFPYLLLTKLSGQKIEKHLVTQDKGAKVNARFEHFVKIESLINSPLHNYKSLRS